jgi:DNA-binding CsgD family transcriptional regulator
MSLAEFAQVSTKIYAAVLDDEQLPPALQAVAEYIGAAGAGCLLIDKRVNRVRAVNSWGCFTGSMAEYRSHYSTIDPFRMARAEAPCGHWLRATECLPDSALRRDEWYNDFLLNGGVRDVLGVKLFDSSSHTVFFGVHQAIGDGHSIPRNPERLDLLIEPLCSAARLHAGLLDVGYQSAIARGALDHLAAGLIFTESDGRVARTNDVAERALRLGDGLTIQNNQLCARRSFETVKLARLIADAASASAPSAGCMLVGRDAGHLPYLIQVAPISAETAVSDRPMAMVLITGLDENCASEHELTQLYGLSPAESRLAVALARGKKLSNIASEIGVQITTLRTQLSAILRKFDVERQSDIVRVISHIPAWASSSDPGPGEESHPAPLGDSSLE